MHTKKRARTMLFNDLPIDIWRMVIQYTRNRDHLTISGINKSTRLLVLTTRLLFDKRLDATTTTRMLSLSTIQTHHVVHHGVTHEMTKESIPTPNDFALMTIDLYISKIMDDDFDTVAAGLTKNKLHPYTRRMHCRIVRGLIAGEFPVAPVDPNEVDPFCILLAARLVFSHSFYLGLRAIDIFGDMKSSMIVPPS